jgi:hypothetical protein
MLADLFGQRLQDDVVGGDVAPDEPAFSCPSSPPGRRCWRMRTVRCRKSTSSTRSPHASLIRSPRPTSEMTSGR